MVKITKKYMIENACYNTSRKIIPTGIMFHTTATEGVMADKWFDRWNNKSTEKSVHFFVDDKSIYQLLPCEKGNCMRASHAGGSANNTHIGVEMCEPKDKYNNKEYFEKAWKNMIDLFVMLSKEFPTIKPSNIFGHCEGFKMGVASNHGDPNVYVLKMGKTMDDFRADVKKKLSTPTPSSSTTTSKPKVNKPSSAWVKKLQNALNDLGHKDSTGKKLTEDGIVGAKTESACPDLKSGANNELVKLAQERLKELGFDCKGADGKFGANTERAVIAMKKKYMNPKDPNGIIGEKSWKVLLYGEC